MPFISHSHPIISFLKREYAGIPLFCWGLIVLYLAPLLFISFIGFYVIPHMLFLLSFILMLPFLGTVASSPLFGRIREAELREKLVVLFILSLLLRGVLLFNPEVITNDITLYAERSSSMVDDGAVPYVDREMNKPPMYAYMLYLMGLGLGPGEMQFRAFFSVVDSLLAVAVFFLLRRKFEEGYSLYGGLIYAICPVNVISTGLEGHYDPLVSLFVIAALYLHFGGRNHLSSINLGVGFAFKLYPFILVPFLVWKLRTWKERITYAVLFFVPMAASWIPLYLIDPRTLHLYYDYQRGQWMSEAMKSFAKAYELVALDRGWYVRNTSEQGWEMIILGQTHTDLFLYFFLLVTGLMFLHWVWARLDREETEALIRRWPRLAGIIPDPLTAWFLRTLEPSPGERMGRVIAYWYRIIVITFVLYYGTQIITGFLLYQEDFRGSLGISDPWKAMALTTLVYFGLAAFVLHRWRDVLFPAVTEVPEKEELFVFGTFSLMFLLFGSPDYPPWYIMWFIPFILGIRTERIRFMLFAVSIWNIPGEGIHLWPGKTVAVQRYRW